MYACADVYCVCMYNYVICVCYIQLLLYVLVPVCVCVCVCMCCACMRLHVLCVCVTILRMLSFSYSVIVDGQQLFILVDMEYIMSIKNYLESIYENILDPNKNETMHEAVVAMKRIEEEHKKAKFSIAVREEDEHMIKRPFKLHGIVSKLAIALLDLEKSDQPQVVMLQVVRRTDLIIVLLKYDAPYSLAWTVILSMILRKNQHNYH